MDRTCTLIFLILGLTVARVSPYKILFAFSFSTTSHRISMDPIMTELLKRGHQVTVIGSFAPDQTVEGAETLTMNFVREAFGRKGEDFFFDLAKMSLLDSFKSTAEYNNDVCSATFRDPTFLEFVKDRRRHFDVIVVDGIFNEYMLSLGHRFSAPVIYCSPIGLFPASLYNLGIPSNPVAFPSSFLPFKGRLNFFQRLVSVVLNSAHLYFRNYVNIPHFERTARQIFPDLPPLLELEKNVSFVLTNVFPTTIGVQPTLPFGVNFGCLFCKPAQKLNKELEQIVNSTGSSGFIYFSLGSLTSGSALPEEFRLKFIEVFKRIPETVLWKFEKPMPDAPPNVKISKWLPQQDLLGHPKCKLFITHGGFLSITEANYHGVPVLATPISADQHGNAAKIVKNEIGDVLDFDSFTVEESVAAIRNLIDNKKYKDNAEASSVFLKDRPMKQSEEAAFWVEYVVRHKGANHLKQDNHEWGFVEYFLIDMVLFALLILAVILFGIVLVLRLLVRLFEKGKIHSAPKKSSKKAQ